jgi:hypothetical protein
MAQKAVMDEIVLTVVAFEKRSCRWRGLKYEPSGRRRQGAGSGPVKMYRLPQAGRW